MSLNMLLATEDPEIIRSLCRIKQLCMILAADGDDELDATDNLIIVRFALQSLEQRLTREIMELTGHEF